MNRSRRTVLVGLATLPVALAGCLEEPGTDEPGDAGEGDGTPEPDDPNPDEPEPDDQPPHESRYEVTVEPVTVDDLHEQFDVGVLDEQSASIQEAVRAATDGGYETETVPNSLATFVADHEYVEVDADYVELDPTFPEWVLTLDPVEGEGIDPADVVGARTFRRNPVVADAVSTAASRGEARRVAYPDFLHDLLAEYDYVTTTDPEDEDADVYAWSLVQDDNGGPPYHLDATSVATDTVFDGDVGDYGDLSAAAQEEFDAARQEGRVGYEDRPAILEGGRRYVRFEGDLYLVSVSVAN